MQNTLSIDAVCSVGESTCDKLGNAAKLLQDIWVLQAYCWMTLGYPHGCTNNATTEHPKMRV